MENNKQKQSFWKPIFSLFSFTSSIIFKKISFWIFLVIFFILILFFYSLPAFFSLNDDFNPTINVFNILVSFFIIIFSAIQGILRAINIFRDTQKEGIEILIVTKAINRKQILISRYLFLFILSLALAIINMLLIAIGMLIVGVKKYSNPFSIIGGVFGSSVISFLLFAMISILFSCFASSRVSILFPIGVLVASCGVFYINTFTNSFISNDKLVSLSNQVIKKLNYKIKEGEQYAFDSGSNIIEFNLPSTSIFVLNNEGNIEFDQNVKLWVKTDSNKWWWWWWNEYIEIGNLNDENHSLPKIRRDISEVLKTIYLPASKLVVYNYLNPISALTYLTGIKGFQFGTNNFIENTIFYNYSLSNIKQINENEYVWTYTSKQADPMWAIAITWASIFIIISGISSFVYARKDFK